MALRTGFTLRGSGPAAAFSAAILARKSQLAGASFKGDIAAGNCDGPVILGPEALRVLSGINIDERDLIKACRGTYALAACYQTDQQSETIPFLSDDESLGGIPLYRICAMEGANLPTYGHLFASTFLSDRARMAHPISEHRFNYRVILDPSTASNYFLRAAQHYGMTPAQNDETRAQIDLPDAGIGTGSTIKRSEAKTLPSRIIYRDGSDQFKIQLSTQKVAYEIRVAKSERPDPETADALPIEISAVLQHAVTGLLPIDRLYFDSLALGLEDLNTFWPVHDESGLAVKEICRRNRRRATLAALFQSIQFKSSHEDIRTQSPRSLQEKIDLFTRRGYIPTQEEDMTLAGEWALRFASLGLRPQWPDPLAARLNMGDVKQSLNHRSAMSEAWADQQMTQIDYLKRMGALNPAFAGAGS